MATTPNKSLPLYDAAVPPDLIGTYNKAMGILDADSNSHRYKFWQFADEPTYPIDDLMDTLINLNLDKGERALSMYISSTLHVEEIHATASGWTIVGPRNMSLDISESGIITFHSPVFPFIIGIPIYPELIS